MQWYFSLMYDLFIGVFQLYSYLPNLWVESEQLLWLVKLLTLVGVWAHISGVRLVVRSRRPSANKIPLSLIFDFFKIRANWKSNYWLLWTSIFIFTLISDGEDDREKWLWTRNHSLKISDWRNGSILSLKSYKGPTLISGGWSVSIYHISQQIVNKISGPLNYPLQSLCLC
jgi:hypothetical protein